MSHILNFAKNNTINTGLMAGEVAIVGAGCGELELMTIKAANTVSQATALVYDSLVSHDILTLVSAECERHFVGKRCGQPSAKQDDINALLLALALKGKKVVRLKGGDPHIFGRGAEESLYLAQHGVKSHFVAGVTAALGCASSSHIPLTYRGVARSVTLITGTKQSAQHYDKSARQWLALLQAESTLVFYMGKEQAPSISAGLLAAGCAPQLGVAFVTNGGRRNQIIRYTTVAEMPQQAKNIISSGPTLMIIGEVVQVGHELQTLIEDIDNKSQEAGYAKCE
ncbi:uroporphyrinogen-III C-methyltransferase [Shewanella intestini]|uniref:uroporphyrinogen-III C-methyltransferase n=2 Tax=Shewanellaceae TaxID=267890 RepID=A0ABS5HZK3_9GAMM|nr:uroporphyrinogen-III C-methyltransferase [Shewanella intestini]MRG35984.1 uroporphyrinogen-III C-methyltransferase [Shewanella sp. XMDDZSB0408]